jgi:hypothetical protein
MPFVLFPFTIACADSFPQKDSSQETIISLMGMLAGSLVVSHISSKLATWTALIFLLSIHLGTNYLAVRAVCMRTINRQRANLVFSDIFEQSSDHRTEYNNRHVARSLKMMRPESFPHVDCPGPEKVYLKERIFERDGVLRWNGENLGYCKFVNLQTALNCFSQPDPSTGSHSGVQLAEFASLLETFESFDYILWYDEPQKSFLVVLKEGAETVTQLSAWMFALFLAKYGRTSEEESLMEAITRTARYFYLHQDEIFQDLLAAGWDLETASMETRSGTRIRMKTESESDSNSGSDSD